MPGRSLSGDASSPSNIARVPVKGSIRVTTIRGVSGYYKIGALTVIR